MDMDTEIHQAMTMAHRINDKLEQDSEVDDVAIPTPPATTAGAAAAAAPTATVGSAPGAPKKVPTLVDLVGSQTEVFRGLLLLTLLLIAQAVSPCLLTVLPKSLSLTIVVPVVVTLVYMVASRFIQVV